MVTVTVSPDWYVSRNNGVDLRDLYNGTDYARGGAVFRIDYESGWFDQFEGRDFRYSSDGTPVGGLIQTYFFGKHGETGVRVDGLKLSVVDVMNVTTTDNDISDDDNLVKTIFSGDDRIIGGNTEDVLSGFDGNDILIGNGGDDQIDGSNGFDIALFSGARKLYAVTGSGAAHTVTSAAEGRDTLTSVEQLSFLDGRLVYDGSDPAAVTLRMYDAMFGRAPDGQGFNYWISALQSGTTAQGMADFFAASTEFRTTYGTLSNQSFVEQLYRNVLDREGEASGVAFWTGQLNGGAKSRGEVLLGFSESPEHAAKLQPLVNAGLWDVDETAAQTARVYSAAFDRAPDADGLAFWTHAIKGGAQTAATMTDFFVQCAEFAGKYGALSNDQFVDRLYLNVLDRAGEASGTAFWTNQLNTGAMDRGDVLLGFSESAENVAKTMPAMTDGILLA